MWTDATKDLAEWLVKNLRPLQLVEDQSFRKFVNGISAMYDIRSAGTMTNYIDKQTL